MNVFVLYIEDDADTGGVKIAAEAFGRPGAAMEIGESIVGSLALHENVKLMKNSPYTNYPATEHPQ